MSYVMARVYHFYHMSESDFYWSEYRGSTSRLYHMNVEVKFNG